jgi:hypothetical protein
MTQKLALVKRLLDYQFTLADKIKGSDIPLAMGKQEVVTAPVGGGEIGIINPNNTPGKPGFNPFKDTNYGKVGVSQSDIESTYGKLLAEGDPKRIAEFEKKYLPELSDSTVASQPAPSPELPITPKAPSKNISEVLYLRRFSCSRTTKRS